jgi:DNA-binding helix-hairpin-helix protein with protein kinase domain
MAAKSVVHQPVYDDQGHAARLGVLLGKGGEGAVYEIVGDPTRVGKIYHNPRHINVEKLSAMVRLNTPSLGKVSAWPERTLHQQRGGCVIGFLMPRADGTSLSDLLGPGSRKVLFPAATYPFVVRTALNLARSFATTHAAGAVVGDVKEVNAVVNSQAVVTLVDTDGFQIRDRQSGRVFFTTAVTPTHQPPELQGIADLSQLHRTPDQDAFGLGVLIFQLLFMGRHPFTGVPTTPKDFEIPEAIKLRQFSWAPTLAHRLYRQPPGTLALASVGSLETLFLRAFLSAQPGGRPSSAEWVGTLQDYERQLKQCSANPAHAFVGTIGCPLCQIETQTSTLLFLGPLVTAARGAAFDVAAIWTQIEAVLSPGQPPEIPPPLIGIASPAAIAVGRVRRRQRTAAVGVGAFGSLASYYAIVVFDAAGLLVALLTFVATWIVWAQGTQKAAAYARARRDANSRLSDLQKQWNAETGDEAFVERKRTLIASRNALADLDQERRRRAQQLQQNVRQRQLDRFLQSQRIREARIPHIGAARITLLRSSGVETAYDITNPKLAGISGFGPALKGALFAWRQQVAGRFHFDPSKGVDPHDLAQLDRDIGARRAQHEQLLRLGPMGLKQLNEHVQRRRKELAPQVQAALAELAQANADAKAAA